MSDHKLFNQLKEIQVTKRAPALWREQTRERLLTLTETQTSRTYNFSEVVSLSWSRVRLVISPVPIMPMLVVMLGLIFGYAPISQAYSASLPGNLFYPVKRTVERVELSLRSTPATQGLFHLKLAERRLNEFNNLPPSATPAQAGLLRDYNIDLSFAQASLQAADDSKLAMQYDEVATELENKLANTKVSPNSQTSYNVAVVLTDKLSATALAVLVDAHQNGQNGLLPAAVAQRLESQISKIQNKLNNMENRISEFPESKSAPRVVLETKQTVVPAKEASREAKKSLTEAMVLIQKKEFTLALQKVQESEDITTKTEAAITKAETPAVATPTEEQGKVDGATTTTPEVKPNETAPVNPEKVEKPAEPTPSTNTNTNVKQ
jgi:hypothetical protein